MKRELNKEKAAKLYNNLIKRGLTEKNIGTEDKFIQNLSNEDNAVKLYDNIKKSKKVGKAFKYSQDDFLNNLYISDNNAVQEEVKQPVNDVKQPIDTIKQPIDSIKQPINEVKDTLKIETQQPVEEVKQPINDDKEATNNGDADIKYLNSLNPNAINPAVSFGTEKNIINTQNTINSVNNSVDSAMQSANVALKENKFAKDDYVPTEEDIKIQQEYDAANNDVKLQIDAINQKREEDKKRYEEITSMYNSIEEIDNAIAQKEKEIQEYLKDKKKTHSTTVSRMGGWGAVTRQTPAYSPEVEAEWERLSNEKNGLELQKEFLHSYKQFEDYDNAEEKWGFLRGLFKTGKFSEFATLGVAEMIKDVKFLKILERADKGENLTVDEQKAIMMYNKLQDMSSKERGFGFESGRGLQTTLQFMLGMFASGGVGGASIKAITQAGAKAGLKQGLKMAGKGAVDGLMKTPLMPAMYKNFTQREVQDYQMSFNPEKVGFDVSKSNDANRFTNFYKAFAETWAERFTESLGNIVDDFGLMTKVLNNKATRKVFGGAIDKMSKLSKNPIYSNTNMALRKVGVNDIPTEMFEEIINVPLQSALLWENQFEQLADKEFYANVALHSFLLGGMGNVVRYTAGGAGYAIERHNINKQFQASTNALSSAALNSNDGTIQGLVNVIQDAVTYNEIVNEEGLIDDSDFVRYYAELEKYIDDNNIDGIKKPLQDYVKAALFKKGEALSMGAYVRDRIGFDFVAPDNNVHIVTLNSDNKNGNQYYIVDSNESGIVLADCNSGQKKIVKQDDIKTDNSFANDYYVEQLFFDNIIGFQADRKNELTNMQLEDEKAERDNSRAVSVDFEGNRYNVVKYDNGVFTVVDDSGNFLDIDEDSVSPVFEDDIIAEQTELNNEVKEIAEANGVELPETEEANQQQEVETKEVNQQQEAEAETKDNETTDEEFLNEIPLDPNKYYRVTTINELDNIKNTKKLSTPDIPMFDNAFLKKVHNQSGVPMEELLELNKTIEGQQKLRQIYTETSKGIAILPRTKSNHGDIGFQKGSTYYDVKDAQVGTVVIVSNNSNTKFEQGHHGSYDNKFNDEIEVGRAVVLREGFEASNFDYYLKTEQGWKKVNIGETTNTENVNNNITDNTEANNKQQYPTDEKGNPLFEQMSIDDSVKMIDELGEYGDKLVDNNIDLARKALDKANKRQPKSIALNDMKAEMQEIESEKENAKKALAMWENIKRKRSEIAIERTREIENNASKTDIKPNEVGENIKQKWNNAAKVIGNQATRTLQDGTIIKGRYVIASADAVTPSHDPHNFYYNNKGFPLNEKGQNINDRDYRNDKNAQQETEKIARNYAGQAIENVPVISPDGVVYDGNGRVMAGQTAAHIGTDGAYLEALSANLSNFGFEQSQLDGIEHPRLYFVMDEALPYTTETFAKFNQQDKKTQTSTERAVSKGKNLGNKAVAQMLSIVDSYETLQSFFASPTACSEIIKSLLNNDIISSTEVASLIEKDKNGDDILSVNGKEFVTDVLIGATFNEDTIRKIGNDKSLKQSVLRALNTIIENRKLGEYTLTDEISRAINLLYEAKKSKMPLSLYMKQGNIFELPIEKRYNPIDVLLAEQFESGIEDFREVIRLYNELASLSIGGQIDMFSGNILTKEQIINEILDRYGKSEQQTEGINNRGKESTPIEVGNTENERGEREETPRETGDNVDDLNTKKQDSNTIEPKEVNVESVFNNLYNNKQTKLSENIEQARNDVEQNPTEAQKEAGNYKKGHINIDGYNISIENPKGSVRSGKDANGKEWSITMNNDYGYIRSTQGVDGDQIDVFLSDNPEEGDVYIVDQVNDKGEFDEHKVMYGFKSHLSAKRAYLSNYSKDWKGLGEITKISKEDFKKWINSSNRKTKPFAEYSIAKKNIEVTNNNRIVSEERYREVREQLRKELSQLNMGLNPKIMILAAEAAVYHIENGAHKFVDFAKKVINDFGEEIRPFLKSMYNSARDYPGMESIAEQMDDYNVVKNIDINTLNTIENDNRGRNQSENTNLGGETQQEVRRPKRERVDRSNDGDSLFDQNGSRGVSQSPNINESVAVEQSDAKVENKDTTPTPKEQEKQTSVKNANNNRDSISDTTPTSVGARYKANIAAIKLMKELISSNKKATNEQMAILKQYSGWGGLGGYFKENTDAELRELLTDEEYESALGSVSSAYYTPSNIISSLWKIAEKLGFKGGNILEGSAGIGNILGLIPDSINGKSDITAVEKDSISGNILKLLYPDANVQVSGFEDVNVRNGSIDLAITNVPFITGYSVFDNVDTDLSKKFKNIHDFCIAKNVRKLRDGGIGIFITSKATMDKSNALREWITTKGNADFIGAFRLNNSTFKGANVTSDIIVIRKRVNGKKSNNAVDVSTVVPVRTYQFDTGDRKYNKKTGEWQSVTKDLIMEYNGYFVNNPNNMAGEMAFGAENGDTYRPESTNLYPLTSLDQQEMLDNFVKSIENKDAGIIENDSVEDSVIVDDASYKTGSLILNSKGKICTYKNGSVIPLDINDKKVKDKPKSEVLKDYKAINEALNNALDYQIKNSDDAGLQPLLEKLNTAYDTFVKKYGNLNKNAAISFLRRDIDFPLIASIEKYNEYEDIDGTKHIKTEKTEVFNKRILGVKVAPKPTNVKDGVISSMYLYNCIDVSYIANELNKTEDEVRQEIISSGLGFENPISGNVEVKYEYLSGNVREKLAQAEANNENGKYNNNIEELKKVVPMDIPAHLIEITLGSTWVDSSLFSDFLKDKYGVNASFKNVGSVWSITILGSTHNEKNIAGGVRSEMFKELITADKLVAAAINNKSIDVKRIVRDYNTNTSTTQRDKKATEACTTRIEEIKDEFKEWIMNKLANDAGLSNELERIYNNRFNGYVPKKIDEIFLPNKFDGANLSIDLYEHQKQAVIRGLSEPILLAHEVGTGKTFSLISTAMEMKRLGTAKKPMIVVQDSTVGQFVTECKKLYPNSKVLTLSDNDRTPDGRREFYGRIKYNSWDIIVIPQSTFNKIPDSPERMSKFIQDKIDDVEYMLDSLIGDDSVDRNIIQDLEKQIKDLQEDLSDIINKKEENKGESKSKNTKLINNTIVKAKAQLDRNSDDVQYFEDMGIDALLIDEAHEYKKLGFTTSMTRGVKGIDPKGSKRAASLFLKTRAILENNGGKNVIFATGTPISNTAAEIWTFMRYLMPKDVMLENDIYYFDDFVHNFGNISKYLEFATNGSFKENTRFAAYSNVPELIRFWSMVSDTVLSKKTINDKVPKISNGGKAQDIFLEQSQSLINIMAAVRSELKRFEDMSGKEKKRNSHIPITMYGMAKRAAIDARLVDSNAVDEPNSKTNRAVSYIVNKLNETERYKGTIALFCDNHRRWSLIGGKKVCDFELFDEIVNKLIEKGVPANQIAIMKGGMSIAKKEKLFSEVNAGNIRVILGTTQTLGTGVNIQERLSSVIHMDAPDRPMDYTQRNGRILRQGNLHKQWDVPVDIIRFGVEDSLDVTAYQRLKTKSQFINSIMDGKTMLIDNQSNRTLEEEEDEGLFDNPVAILSGSQYAQLKNKAERDLRKYKNKLQQYNSDQAYVNTKIKQNNSDLELFTSKLEAVKEQKEKTNKYFPDKTYKSIEIEGVKCSNEAQIDKAFKDKINKAQLDFEAKARDDRYFNGPKTKAFTIKVDNVDVVFKRVTDKTQQYDQKLKLWKISVTTKWSYSIPDIGIEDNLISGKWAKDGLIEVVDEIITQKSVDEEIEFITNKIQSLKDNTSIIKERLGKPFEYSKELEAAQQNVDKYTELMKEEMRIKEEKYANAVTNGVDINSLNNEEEIEDGTDNEDSNVSYEVSNRQIDSNTNATNAVLDMLNNAGVDVEIVSQEELVNLGNNTQLKTPNGIIYGAVYNGKIYLNKDALNSNTPIHEYTHLWDTACKERNPELWNRGKELMKQTSEWQEVMKDSNYADIHNDEDKVASEVHSRLTGKRGEEKLNELQKNIDKKGFFKGVSLIADLKKWLNDFWYWVKDSFTNWSKEDADIVSLDDFINMPISDLAKGVNPMIRNNEKSYSIVGNDTNNTIPQNYNSNDVEYTLEDKFREKVIDNLQSVRKLQEEIEKEGIDIDEQSNPYTQSLLSSSIASAEFDKFNSDIFQPLINKIVSISKALTKKGYNTFTIKGDIIDFLYARHAIERNRKICLDEITESVYDKLSDEEKDKLNQTPDLKGLVDDVIINGYDSNFGNAQPMSTFDIIKRITFNTDNEAMALWSKLNARINKAIRKVKKSGNNRSGMTDIEANAIINTMYTNDTSAMLDELQADVKQATDFTLDKWLEYGLISKSQYDNYKNMYQYYIPLRNWEQKEDVDYNNLANTSYRGTGDLLNMNKAAKGRKSKAANPLVFIANMAQSAVVVGNKNRVRQCAFNLVSNNADMIGDLATIEKVYLIDDGFGNIYEQFTKPTQQQIVIDEQTDRSYRWHKTNAELNAHQVSVMIDGQKYVITFKGELGARAAGAISGANSIFRLPDSLSNATRFLSAGYTSANPYFMFRNLFRDMQFGFALNYLNRGILDTGRLSVNYIKSFRAIHRDLVGKGGTAIDAMYEDFKLNGGKTGYIHIYEMQKLQDSINRDLRKASGDGNIIRIGWDRLIDIIETSLNYMGEMSENAMRFAAYRTAIENGTSEKEAALRAKEATVNFNRKGSASNVLGSLYVFFNASVQGTYTLAKAIKHNPYRGAALISTLAGISFLSTLLCSLSGGDDDDSYDRVSDFQKQTNFMLPLGNGKYFAIPYGQGLRVFSNIGYNAAQFALDKKDEKEVFNDMFWFGVGDFAPFDIDAIDFKGEDIDKTLIQAFSPSVVRPLYEVTINRNFMGLPIYREPFMKSDIDYTPRYKFANKNTSDLLVKASKYLNNLAGGTDYLSARKKIDKDGNVVNSNIGELLDINPAKVEHIAKGIVGGRFSFPKDIANVFTSLASGEFGTEKIDFLNMFIKSPTSKAGYKEYYRLRDEVKDIEKIDSIIRKENIYGEKSSIDFMKNNNNYIKKSLYDSYSKIINEITNTISIIPKTEEYKEKIKELEELRDNLVKECADKYKDLKTTNKE